MIQNNLTNGLMAALLLASPMVGAETQYPAADFQPKVIYQDAEQIAQHGKTGAATGSAAQTKPDAKYPAAAFEPKVLYKDENYKPSSSASVPVSEAPAARTTTVSTSGAAETTAAKPVEKSSNNMILLAVIAAAAGFVLFKRQSKSQIAEARSSYPVYSTEPGNLTGVARYLNKAAGTGVSRYLEKHSKTEKTVTGVAKYMAKQSVAPRAKPAAVTGVEKYMSKRG